MLNYSIIAETEAEYQKTLRELEKTIMYERGIVQSVPEQTIEACSELHDADIGWEPG